MIGKPDSGKLNVRFDEGELEIEPRLLRQFPTLPFFPKKIDPLTPMDGSVPAVPIRTGLPFYKEKKTFLCFPVRRAVVSFTIDFGKEAHLSA